MLILAVYKRVELYSLTEARYMLLLYGLLLIFSSFILLKRATIHLFSIFNYWYNYMFSQRLDFGVVGKLVKVSK